MLLDLGIKFGFLLSISALTSAWSNTRPLVLRLNTRASPIASPLTSRIARRNIFDSLRRYEGKRSLAHPPMMPTVFAEAKMSADISSSAPSLNPPSLPLAETILVEYASARESFALRYLKSFTALRVASVSLAFTGALYRYLPRLCTWLYKDMKTDPMDRALHATGRYMPITAKFRTEKRDKAANGSSTIFSGAALDALMNRDLGFRTRIEMFLIRSVLDVPVLKRLHHYLNEVYINITSKLTV